MKLRSASWCRDSSASARVARLGVRHQDQALVAGVGIDADAPQRVEIGFDRVPARGFRLAIEMREMPAPQARARGALARDRPARAQQARQLQPARMLGQVDEEVEAPRAQPPQQPPFLGELGDDAALFPAAVDGVHLRDSRVPGQHDLRAAIDQRVDFRAGHGAGKGGEHRRSQQYVAMMAQLGYEHAMNFCRGTGSESGLAMVDNDTKIRVSAPDARTQASALTRGAWPGADGSAPIGVQFAQVPARPLRPTGPTTDPTLPHVLRCRPYRAEGADPGGGACRTSGASTTRRSSSSTAATP